MCGIAAIFDPAGNPVDDGHLQRMIRVLDHRGPDDSGIYSANGIGMGSTRLSILDLTEAGHMPMHDERTGNWIIHNGEIYNYRELIADLALRPVRSNTDTEVILAAYEKLGQDCVRYFNGIFAFIIWDAAKQMLFCARDRLGVKPLLYTKFRGRTILASEAKALFAVGSPREPDNRILREYLTSGLYDHGTSTFFEGVEQLAPAHVMTLSGNDEVIEKYWDLEDGDFQAAGPVDDEQAATAYFEHLVNDAIKLQLRTDTPLAVHVSGGLDSMMLMSIIHSVNGGQGNVKALSQIYGEETYDERRHVDSLADTLGWSVEYYKLDNQDVPEIAETAIWQQEQPFPGMVTLAKQTLMAKSQHHGAKVVLEGQGGDEIGAGYQYYFGPYILDLFENGQAELAVAEIKSFAKLNNMDQQQAMRLVIDGIDTYENPGRSADGTLSVSHVCLSSDLLETDQTASTFVQPFKSKLLNMQYRDIFCTKLPRILRSCDRASMGNSRELRVPLLDHRLVEFSFNLPSAAKIKNGVQRKVMRDVLKRYLPSRLISEPKRAVVDPQKDWLRGPLQEWVRDIIHSRSFAERGYFDVPKVVNAYDRFINDPSARNSFHVWQWVVTELWFRRYIDASFETAS